MVKKTEALKAREASQRDVRFVNYDLTDEDKKVFKSWAHENAGQEGFEIMMRVVESGFNLSVKWSEFDGCHVAFLIPTDKKTELKGWLLSGRGSTPWGAIMGCFFRHLVLFEENWPIREDVRRSRDDEF